MGGFLEFEVPCPKCSKYTGILDVGNTYEQFHCTNKECNHKHSESLNVVFDDRDGVPTIRDATAEEIASARRH
jgi:hypothetical protein